MINLFNWHLPFAPTEKKLKHSMEIATFRKNGFVIFDHSFISLYRNKDGKIIGMHPTDSNSHNLEIETKFR